MESREKLVAAALAAAAVLAACAPAKRAPAPIPAKPAAPLAAAQPAPAPVPAAVAMPSGTLTRVGGTVVSEDAAAHYLTIKDYRGRTRTFRVAGAAKLTKGGDEESIGLASIAAGDRVKLKVGGDVVASAHVMVAAAK
ncbi:MAG TPA: hypothetical protein VN915_14915 [Elusimicrobiota bacterium]|nr:hypothetical protein [Elusimicrobiota bacterium]